jgi:hypothetical protein
VCRSRSRRAAISDKALAGYSDLELVELTFTWLEKAFKGWDKSNFSHDHKRAMDYLNQITVFRGSMACDSAWQV